MNAPHHSTTYDSTGRANASAHENSAAKFWPRRFVTCAATYYLLSALTLPIVNRIWLGEIPLLALIQLPKSFLKSAIHTPMMSAMNSHSYVRPLQITAPRIAGRWLSWSLFPRCLSSHFFGQFQDCHNNEL